MKRLMIGRGYPGGWKFMDNGVLIESRDGTYQGLVEAVRQYRVNKGRSSDNLEKEIEVQLCASKPEACHDMPAPRVDDQKPVAGISGDNLALRVIAWCNYILQDQLEYVGEGEAMRRATICAGCTFQKNWGDTSCGKCLSSARHLTTVLRGNRPVPVGKALMGCSALGQDNSVAVWLDKSILPKGEGAALPAHCWVKQENVK